MLLRKWLTGLVAFIALGLGAQLAYGQSDAVLAWFASRPLYQQTRWARDVATDTDELLRKSYLLGELAVLAYGDPDHERLKALGFRHMEHIRETGDLSVGDVGTVVRIGGGNASGAIIGDSPLAAFKGEADAMVSDTLDGSARVVAVRGTEFMTDIFDLLLDLNAGTIAKDGIVYHAGFFLFSHLLYDRVRAELGAACKPGGQAVWLTGHSLGGASAEVLALWLSQSGCTVDGVITFAAPLPGRESFGREYEYEKLDEVTDRWVHRKDPVPCLPLGTGWARVGSQHTVTEDSVTLNDSKDYCNTGDDSLEGRVFGTLLKIYEVTDIVRDFEEWAELTAQDIGLCHNHKKVWRGLLAALTLGGSEVACETLDTVTDIRSVSEQVKNAAQLLLANRSFREHQYPECLYVDRIAEEGEALGTFGDPIWAQHMEKTWQEHPHCPSSFPTHTPQPIVNWPACPAGKYCCEALNETTCSATGCVDHDRPCL